MMVGILKSRDRSARLITIRKTSRASRSATVVQMTPSTRIMFYTVMVCTQCTTVIIIVFQKSSLPWTDIIDIVVYALQRSAANNTLRRVVVCTRRSSFVGDFSLFFPADRHAAARPYAHTYRFVNNNNNKIKYVSPKI